MATRVKKSSKIGKRISKAAKTRSLDLGLGPGSIVRKAIGGLTKGEKALRKKTKLSINETIRDSERIGMRGLAPSFNPKGMTKQKIEIKARKVDANRRKFLRSQLRTLGKIEGDKKMATQAQKRINQIMSKPSKAKPRKRITK